MKVFEKNSQYGNPILTKSFDFSVRIVKFYSYFIKRDYDLKDLYRQVLRSGTSIGANISESQEAVSKKDFINKLSIALKEARETEYWLKILVASNNLTESEAKSLLIDCEELIKLLVTIIKKLKE